MRRQVSTGRRKAFIALFVAIGIAAALAGVWWTVVAMAFGAVAQAIDLRRVQRGEPEEPFWPSKNPEDYV